MQLYPLKLVTVVGESVIMEDIAEEGIKLGATGYSMSEVIGHGSRSARNVGEAGGAKTLKIEFVVPSDVAAGYAPPGQSLVCVSVRGEWQGEAAELPEAVRCQAAGWFDDACRSWRHLATVDVKHALPDESPAARRLRTATGRLAPGLFLCGDHCTTASINGALASGRRCAEAILSEQ